MKYKEFEAKAKEWNGKTCIFGAGLSGRTWVYDMAVAAGFFVDFFCDNMYEKGILIVDELKTISLQELYNYGDNVLILLAIKEESQEQVVNQLVKNGITNIIKMGYFFLQDCYFEIEKASDEVKTRYRIIMDDAEFLKKRYEYIMGTPLDIEKPRRFNEKLQWLKINNHNKQYVDLVDKYEAKNIVSSIIGKTHIIPTLGVWDNFDDINFETLPNEFVLKCTHDSGSVIICKDKKNLDLESARKKLEKGLKTNYYVVAREWPYKNIKPRIIAEEYKQDNKSCGLDDYKFFCFDGSVDNVMVVRGRDKGNPKFYHFDKNWKICRLNRLGRSLPDDYSEDKPEFIDKMIEIAEKLSKNIPHVRIDLYEVNGEIYFGEYTFFHQSGCEDGFDEKADLYLGGLINLSAI